LEERRELTTEGQVGFEPFDPFGQLGLLGVDRRDPCSGFAEEPLDVLSPIADESTGEVLTRRLGSRGDRS
jgi:hypothetical protein